MGWRVYYADGSTFTSKDGTWEEAPDHGVQVVVTYQEPPYKVLYDGIDEYVIPGETAIKYGSRIPDDHFYALQSDAMDSLAP